MCGIVSYFGQSDGMIRVLEALHLLVYRAPDSAGVSAITESGELVVRRSVGSPSRLVAAMAADPLYERTGYERRRAADLLAKQGYDLQPESLRECSPAAGYTVTDLYGRRGLRVGFGDRGAESQTLPAAPECQFSLQMCQTLDETGALASPDYDRGAVRHAFRLVAAQVASRAALDKAWEEALDTALLSRVPDGAYATWRDAWNEEVILNTPGQAFSVAVRRFQETFPGLAEHLAESEWERVGGLTAQTMAYVVLGHGRWAMVGAVTEANAHPLLDRSCTRSVCENGSHNASLMLQLRSEQETWWRARGVPEGEPVHRSENTTEAIAYEWERVYHQLREGKISKRELQLCAGFDKRGVQDLEERALRLALTRITAGNAHACAFHSRRNPGVLYVSSHNKPIAIAVRGVETGDDASRYDIMVASDVNAALMLWPGDEVDAAASRIQVLRDRIASDVEAETDARRELEALLDRFTVDVVFLDTHLCQGEELLARIYNRVEAGRVVPVIELTRYDGTPVPVTPEPVRLNAAMVGRHGYATYTEGHIAEIPDVLDDLVRTYVEDGHVQLDGIWHDGTLVWPGLNAPKLRRHFGQRLEGLRRLLLIGEGSSWRDAQAAAPLFRKLLPGIVVNVYRPVEVLNLGTVVNAATDLVVEISWSGTTDSVLKVDRLLGDVGVLRLGVTGKPQSDLGRRTAGSAGTLNVRTGVEVSVATVKGFEAVLATLDLLASRLGHMRDTAAPDVLTQTTHELARAVPEHVRYVIEDDARRQRIRSVAERCRHCNKVAVVGGSPIDLEGELKIEELAQIVGAAFDFHTASLRSLIDRSARVPDDRGRTLFIINATTPALHRQARAIINYLDALGVFFIIHTTLHKEVATWEAIPAAEVFVSPQVSELLQPLIDAPFFFDFAVALAYARGLTPQEIDRPRNLAKSVTTTGAEPRSEVEAREQFDNATLDTFSAGSAAGVAPDQGPDWGEHVPSETTVALRAVLAAISEPLPRLLSLRDRRHLIVLTDTEATENAAHMAASAWSTLLDTSLTVYRRFISELPDTAPDTALLRILRAGAVLSVPDPNTIALPADMSPLELELLGASYLISLAARLARQRGEDTVLWETGLARLPQVIDEVLHGSGVTDQVREPLSAYVAAGYDKAQIIGGGQDYASALSIARSLRSRGFMAEALYTDSAWHGPLATVGGPDAEHDTLIVILATDPLFQSAALVDTQVYRTRRAPVFLVVPAGNQELPAVCGVGPSAVLTVPAVPRPFGPVLNAAFGAVLAQEMDRLWARSAYL